MVALEDREELYEDRRKGDFNGRIQTVIQVIVTGVLIWIGTSIVDIRDRLIKLETLYQVEILSIKERLHVLEQKNSLRR